MKAVQTYNLVKTKRRARVTGGANLSYKGQGQGHCDTANENVKKNRAYLR